MKAKGVIILDRDGVINIDSPLYIKSAEEFNPIAGSIQAIADLYRAGFRIYIATNQAGLAKGKFDLEALNSMHQKLCTLVEQEGGKIEEIVYCPHHPDDKCKCRKPEPGMLLQIANTSGHPPTDIDFVGDSVKDVEAAWSANTNPILVLTGNGEKSSTILEERVPTFQDLATYAEFKLQKAN